MVHIESTEKRMKKFLSKEQILAAALAAVASGAASANLPTTVNLAKYVDTLTETIAMVDDKQVTEEAFTLHRTPEEISDHNGLHAYHSSHASHGSHASHASHASSSY